MEAEPQISGCWACSGRSSSSQKKGLSSSDGRRCTARPRQWPVCGGGFQTHAATSQCLSANRLHAARIRETGVR